ncbi:hypothetical protein [Ralstonia pseudosolanacearum]
MKKTIRKMVLGGVLLLPVLAQAQMVEIGSDSYGAKLYVNPKTETIQYDEAGYLTLGYATQYTRPNQPVLIDRSYVRVSDCMVGMGFVYIRNMDNYFQFKSNWVDGGASVASLKGSLFCEIAKQKKLY